MKNVIAVVLTLMVSQIVMADGAAEFKYRQGVMHSVGGHMSSMAAILRGQVHLGDLKLHARGLADLAVIVPTIFEGSGVKKSEALPAIWEKPVEFKSALDKFVKAANGMAAAADSGEMSNIGPAMKALGKSCKNCHDNFRKEDD